MYLNTAQLRDGHLNCVNAKKVIFGCLPFSGRNISSTGQQTIKYIETFIVCCMLTKNFVLIEIVVSQELRKMFNFYTMYGTKPFLTGSEARSTLFVLYFGLL